MDSEHKIIVFDSYDNVIKANLCKIKLDAYGIPCFLTGENFVNLYPIRNELFPGVRLYIFANDGDRVREILIEDEILPAEVLICPHCKSGNILFEESPKGWLGRFLSLPLFSALAASFFFGKKVYRCQNCQTEFNP